MAELPTGANLPAPPIASAPDTDIFARALKRLDIAAAEQRARNEPVNPLVLQSMADWQAEAEVNRKQREALEATRAALAQVLVIQSTIEGQLVDQIEKLQRV